MESSQNIAESSPEKPVDKDNRKERVKAIGSTLAEIRARVKANRSCSRKDEDQSGTSKSAREKLSEKSELYMQVLEQDKAKAQRLEKERPKIKEAIENLKIDRENQKLVEKKIEETRAKQSAPLPEIPQEVQKRILDLELVIHHLEETLSEKERVLQSKTDSWRLLSEQLEERNNQVVERSEMMKREIEQVKVGYAQQEVFFKGEIERLSSNLQQAQSLLISKENETLDFNKVTTELEELKAAHAECDSRYQETKKALDFEKRLSLKLKAQLKNIRNEMSNSKIESLTAEVGSLQNKIASLEEEKGNLLLQLVEFDEIKESAQNGIANIKKLEEALKSSKAQTDKLKQDYNSLNESCKAMSSQISEKDSTIAHLQELIEKLENLKIVAELKAVELEEKLDFENKDDDRGQYEKIEKELNNLKCHVREQESKIVELSELLKSKDNELSSLLESKEGQSEFSESDLKHLLQEWKHKYSQVEQNMKSLEYEKHSYEEAIQQLQKERNELLDCINEKESIIERNKAEIANLMKSNQEYCERAKKAEEDLKNLGSSKEAAQKSTPDSSDVQLQKFKKVAANLKIKIKQCKDLEANIEDLTKSLNEKNSELLVLTEENSSLKELVEKYESEMGDSSTKSELKKIVADKEAVIEDLIQSQKKELLAVQEACTKRMRAESFTELNEKESEIIHLKEENLLLESKLNENLTEIISVSEGDGENLLKKLEDSLLKVQNLTKEVETNNSKINELEATSASLSQALSDIQVNHSQTLLLLQEKEKELECSRQQMTDLLSSKKGQECNLSEHSILKEQLAQITIELENSKLVTSSKEEVIKKLEQEFTCVKQALENSEKGMDEFQKLYNEESERNNSTLNTIQLLEVEMDLSKKEINFLSEQLSSVTNSYESSMDQLKEKDDYIKKLELEVTQMRNKMSSLENSMLQHQQIMEERARTLGEKLQGAESMNLNFEQYQRSVDQKFAQLNENELLLKNRIAELVEQLDSTKKSNDELSAINNELEGILKTSHSRVQTLEGDLDDIKSSYNNTLDQIEVLNEELKQVMSQIETRNQELDKIGEERNMLAGRLSKLEITCRDLQSQLQESENASDNLKSELDSKLRMLEQATSEITQLQEQLGSIHSIESNNLNTELDRLKADYQARLKELEIEKDDLMKVLKGSLAEEVNSLVKTAEEKVKSVTQGQVKEDSDVKLFTWKDAEQSQSGNDPFEDIKEDEGWGWNATEAKLEQEHQVAELSKAESLKNEISSLQSENSQLKEQNQNLQEKCRKLAKKVKELKTLCEMGKSSPVSTGFQDLDFALLEELRGQVDKLETKNKDLGSELNSLKQEKEKLLKRVETLTSANEQFVEMKERQDVEMQVCQRRIADLKSQLQSFEWPAEDRDEVSPKKIRQPVAKTPDLENKLNLLENENEELQQIIIDLKDAASKNGNSFKQQIEALKAEINDLNSSQTSQSENIAEVEHLNKLLASEKLLVDEKDSVINNIKQEKLELENRLQDIQMKLEDASNKLNTLMPQVESGMRAMQEVENLNELLSIENKNSEEKNLLIGKISNEKKMLEESLLRLEGELKVLMEKNNASSGQHNSELAAALNGIESLTLERDTLLEELKPLRDSFFNLQEEKKVLEQKNKEKQQEIDMLILQVSRMEELRAEIDRLVDEKIKLEQKLKSKKTSVEEKIVPAASFFQEAAPSSLPVFKGFSDVADDPFSDVTQQIISNQQTSFPITGSDSASSIEKLKQKISQLGLENASLNEQIISLKQQISDCSNIIQERDKKLVYSNQQLETVCNEVIELKSLLAEYEAQNREISSSASSESLMIQSLETEIGQLRNEVTRLNQALETSELQFKQQIESVRLMDSSAARGHFEEELRKKEVSFQNTILEKDEENAHLTCEVSALKRSNEKLLADINSLKEHIAVIEPQLNELKSQNENLLSETSLLKQELERKNEEMRQLQISSQQYYTQFDYLSQSCAEKDSLIGNLQLRYDEQSNSIISLQNELDACKENLKLLEERAQSVQSELSSKSEESLRLTESLNYVSQQKEQLETTVNNLTVQLNEQQIKLDQNLSLNAEMKNSGDIMLTNLGLEIETLQSSISEKDLEIERLSKMLVECQEKLIRAEESKVTDEVVQLRGKLDQALYTVHLRDVRCDELTHEIMNLLEERDSLQLRLSDALRNNESLRSLGHGQITPPPQSPVITSPPQQGPVLTSDSRIDELHTAYMKDPTVKMDQQSRHSQQMHLYSEQAPKELLSGSAFQKEENSSDYGIFNWFFGSSSNASLPQDQT